MISTQHRFLFIHVSKTGGNSIQEALLDFSDDRKRVTMKQDGIERFGVEGPVAGAKHWTLAEYEAALGPDVIDSMLVFATLRNPWERAVSAYYSPLRWMRLNTGGFRAVEPQWSKPKFRKVVHGLKTTSDFLRRNDGRVHVDRLLRFENLSVEFADLMRERAIDCPPLQTRNRGLQPQAWQEIYRDAELADWVAEQFAEDLERWPFPRPDQD